MPKSKTSLNAFLGDGYRKYADSDGRFYLSYLDAQNKRASFLNEIVENVDVITPKLKRQITNLIDETYEATYSGMVEALKKADTAEKLKHITADISVQEDVLKETVNNNVNKLTLPSVLEKHRAEIVYSVQQELAVGLMNGDRYDQMAKRIAEKVNISQTKAMNIARTESHRNIESGFMDCAEDIQSGLDGSEYIYAATWRTMKDGNVRPYSRRRRKKRLKIRLIKCLQNRRTKAPHLRKKHPIKKKLPPNPQNHKTKYKLQISTR
ncbi:MAG: phage head morphogenesis protein [Clostridiales bacterium]|nr:phage head morphogenesis protein [Clostridiales bacterium]